MRKLTKGIILVLTAALLSTLLFSCAFKGNKGDKGDSGANGLSAYELAVSQGFEGSMEDWLLSLVGSTGQIGAKGDEGDKGDKGDKGEAGVTPLLRVNAETNMWEISYDNGISYTSLGIQATGDKGDEGDQGDKGDTGITPLVRVNAETNMWEVSYDNGETYASLGIQATGDKGDVGNDGVSPELRINSESNEWEISYDNGTTWQSLGVPATGSKGEEGEKGDTGTTPLLRVNTDTNMWEVSYDNGETYASLGIQATGDKGEQGDKGDTGKSAYQLYLEKNPEYTGTEEEWLFDVLNGTLVKHTVTFDLNGGTAPDGFSATVSVGLGKSISLTLPTREGYTFLGWYTGSEVTDGIFTTTDAVTGDLNLIARWQINKVTVTFLDYYGDIAEIQEIDYGTAASAPTLPEKITEEKVYFDGWDKSFTKVTENITVRASYSHRVYKVTYNTGDASAVPSQNVYFGEIPTKPADPTKTDYVFEGWYLDEAFTVAYNFDTALDKDTVIYANVCEYIMIKTMEDLIAIGNNTGSKYMLANDINLEGNLWTPIYSFSGILDGNEHKISNFAISNTDYTTGFVANNYGTIKNIDFVNVGFSYTNSFTSSDSTFSAGVIAGYNSGTVENCELVSGSAVFNITSIGYNGNNVHLGALAGENYGTVSGCINNIDVDYKFTGYFSGSYKDYFLYSYVSSGIGYNYGNIEKTEVYGNINCTANTGGRSINDELYNYLYIGAIAGENTSSSSKISKCTANINITLSYTETNTYSNKNSTIGTICGRNYGTVEDSKASGKIDVTNSGTTLSSQIGGAVGYNCENAKVTNIYSSVEIKTGSAVSGSVGGVVGENAAGSSLLKSVYIGNLDITSEIDNYGLLAAVNNGTVHNCYYSNTSIIEVNDVSTTATLTTGTAEHLATIKTVDFIYNKLFWKSDIWEIEDGQNPYIK